MLRRYLFEITLATLIICGLIALFFIYSASPKCFKQHVHYLEYKRLIPR